MGRKTKIPRRLGALGAMAWAGPHDAGFGAEKTFRAGDAGVRIEVITSGEYPGDELPEPVYGGSLGVASG